MNKKIISCFVAFLFTLSMAISVTATENTDIAAYLSGDFYGHNSMTVNGSIYSSDGNIKFGSASNDCVFGDITLNAQNEYIIENQNSLPKITGTVIKAESTSFPYTAKMIAESPQIENFVESYTTSWWPLPDDVTSDVHYGSLTLQSDLNIDTSAGDITIVCDSLSLGTSGKLTVSGDGQVMLFVKSALSLSGSCAINPSGSRENVSIFVNGNISLSGNNTINGNLYLTNDEISISGSGKINGNVMTNAKSLEIYGGGKINGTVYAPLSDVLLHSSGKIEGMLIAKSLEMYGSSTLTYNSEYVTQTIPEKVEKYVLEVSSNNAQWGTVTVNSTEYQSGETAVIVPTPASGYVFKGFESQDGIEILPDENGNLPMDSSRVLVAVFEKATDEKTVINDIPNGTPVLITFPYAYLYGYDYGDAGAEDNIKREEACALIYRLLKQDDKLGDFIPGTEHFDDVPTGFWSENALAYMKHIGVYSSEKVNPWDNISRGEMAKIICYSLRINVNENSQIGFTDLDETNPYYVYIKALCDNNIMIGYGSTVNPDGFLTRAEYVTMINRIIGRGDEYFIDDIPSPYPDMQDSSYWAYADIMRASFGFSDAKTDGHYTVDPTRKPARETIDYD